MIAHLDIKPNNVVIELETERIFIIDFDLARECNDIDEMVEISSGTRGYAAPEIILDNDKPSKRISPIRADLWSCGIVLKEILDRAGCGDRDISLLIKLLTVTDASQRPLLHKLIDEKVDFWVSGQFTQVLHSHELVINADVERKVKRCRDNSSSLEIGLPFKVSKTENDLISHSYHSMSSSYLSPSLDSAADISSIVPAILPVSNELVKCL